MKSFYGNILFIAVLFATNFLHAQITNLDLSAIEATTPSSPDDLPLIGNYYSAANPDFGPAPANFFGLWGWSLGGENYLLDDLPGAPSGGTFAMDGSYPPLPDGYDGTNAGVGESFDNFSLSTNGLWLWITNAANNTIYANLNGATDYVYEIFSTTNVAAVPAVSNWDIETEVFPVTNTTVSPFTVPMNGRNPLFLWARDWTGITNNGNITPEWWLWSYFGTIDLSDSNLDGSGQNTLLYDYANTNDPNVIQFSMLLPNLVTASTFTNPISLWQGIPDSIAVLVNDPNYDDAVWKPYSGTNLIVTLGSTSGPYTVYVGLRGSPQMSPLWETNIVILDATPAFLVVTNPISSTVSQPVIQLQGYASKALTNLTFDVSNAMGVLTNQPGFLAGQTYDTNLLEFTTNYFECYDVPLANGLNTVTLQANFLSGQTIVTNINLWLDYSSDTNPPMLSILWPQNGANIGGTNFTLQAQVDDDTATVTAQITDAYDDTNTIQGMAERNGLVWAPNLPLAAGTNVLTVSATNAAGLSTTTNMIVVQSGVSIAINPLSNDELRQPSATVSGTINPTNYSVFVNGIEADVSSNGTWQACSVPVNGNSLVAFNVIADPPGDPEINQSLVQLMPSIVQVSSYQTASSYNDILYHFCNGSEDYDSGSSEDSWVLGDAGAPPAPPWACFSDGGVTSEYNTDDEISPCHGDGFYIYSSRESASTQAELVAGGQWGSGQQQPVLLLMQVNNYSDGSPVAPSNVNVMGQYLTPTPTNANVGYELVAMQPTTVSNITPSIPNITYTAQPLDWNLQIIDQNTGNILSGQTNSVIVGQQMNLICQLSMTNSMLNNSMLTNFQWTVPGYAISNYVVAADDSSATVVTNFPTTNSTALFYWVDGSTNILMATNRIVSCSAMIDGITISNEVAFKVLRPMANITPQTTSVKVQSSGGVVKLIFAGSTASDGITFSNTIVMPANFLGSAEWVQVDSQPIGELEDTNSTNHSYTENGPGPYLDTTFPYLTKNPVTGFPVDSPGFRLDTLTSEYVKAVQSDTMEMWLLFQPTNGIPVPLRAVNWYWSGTATNDPSGSNGWGLESGTNTINPSDFDTETYPVWNSNVTNETWIPPLL